MRRSIWIFLASIFLPSLALAWMAVRSAEDQQVVLEHQQVIICQNISDTLAQNIQAQMDQVRADFVSATQQLLTASPSPQALAEDFNTKLPRAWPMAEIGFAVNIDGEIYSPKAFDGPSARTFRSENDRFLSNRENVQIYSSNSSGIAQTNFKNGQNAYPSKKSALSFFDLNTMRAPAGAQSPLVQPEISNSVDADKQLEEANQEKIAEATKAINEAAKSATGQSPVSQGESDYAMAAGSMRAKDMPENATAAAPAVTADSSAAMEASLQQVPQAAPMSQSLAGRATATHQARITAGSVASAAAPAPTPALDELSTATKAQPQAQQLEPENGRRAERLSHAMSESFAKEQAVPRDANVSAASSTVSTITAAPATTAPAFAPDAAAAAMPAAPTMAAPVARQDAGATMNINAPATTPIGGALEIPNGSPPGASAQDESQQMTLNSEYQSNGHYNVNAGKIPRQVVPQKMLNSDAETLSNTVPEESDFRRAIGTGTSGALARFLENKLRLMVWSHPADTSIVFGAQLETTRLADALKAAFQIPELQPDSYSRSGHSEYCVAILDDTGQPVALSLPGFHGDWKHPFVATEIGETLPHWEAALYLVDPQRIGRAARTLRYTLGLIVLLLVAAIASGGSLVAADVRRQMRLAQQKTDFVSNVSHELKTPLTSIRMFADLLAEKRVPDEQRQSTYLRIISAEAARLTRLINNVLDFARLERGAPPGEHRDCDLVDAVRDVVETCGPHLEAAGVEFRHEIEADALPIRGDRDALAQIILNLVSNAEKYGGNDILVRVRRQETPGGTLGCVDVLDRGPGIPADKVRTVFEPFHRLDDSLSSGVPGSGLGLTLARRMARSHGGEVTYAPRAGGGSCFTLTVPLRTP